MNFKILCRSFEARTKPYQIKQTEAIDFEPGRTDAHTHVQSPFHSPLTNFVRRGQLI